MHQTWDILRDIERAVVPPARPWTKTGTVTTASPLQVAWVGEPDSGAVWPKVDTYTPNVGDTVVAIGHGNTWLVVSSVNTTAEGVFNAVGAAGQPAFLNSWVNYGGAFGPARFYKDASGFVHVFGLIKSGSSVTAPIFTLPAGYRPGFEMVFTTNMGGPAQARLEVTAAGSVFVSSATTGATTSFLSLDGITPFMAEN